MDRPDTEPDNDFSHDDAWECCRIKIAPEQIAHLTAVMEGYDNQFIVRAEDPGVALMRIWYAAANRPVLEEVLLDLRREIAVKVLSYSKGMEGLDQVIPE